MTDAVQTMKQDRLLIFVVAYYAESTLKSVLERIPSSVFEDYDCEILVVDDASDDRTFAIGQEYRHEHPHIPLTVLRNEYNQGYGGNQKVGYHRAIEAGFDFVAMVHGDGQYAPEALPALLAPLREREADAVFGSRMMDRLGALKGGMPLYKFVGNKILTFCQNLLLGSQLSEFHSGYRIYSVKALQKIRFELNSNDFHFDTEIIIQLMNLGARIVELPIPTYYGDEICRVNGVKYAGDVMRATLRNVAHRSGVLYQRKYDPVAEGNDHSELKLGYPSSHQYAIDSVPAGARVLDLASGPGAIARELVKKGCSVTVVDRYPPAFPGAGIKAVAQDLNEPLQVDPAPYDCILMLDVIEHLSDPEKFLAELRQGFDHRPRKLVLTTGNIAFLTQRLMLLFGQFNYGKMGILDRTHTRLFTFRAIKQLLRDEGFRVKAVKGIPVPFPKIFGNGAVGKGALALNDLLIRFSKSLFAYQIYIEAETTPVLGHVVRTTEEATARRIASANDVNV